MRSSLTGLVMLVACGPAQVEAPTPSPAPSPGASASAAASTTPKPAPPTGAPSCESVAMAWSATLVPDPEVAHLAVSADALWLASDEAIYVSADHGATFDARTLDLPSVDPTQPATVLDVAATGTTIFVATKAHVMVGTDLAQSMKLAFAPTETRGGAIAPSPIAGLWAGDDGAVLAEKNGTLRRSEGWAPMQGLPPPAPPARAIAGNADGWRYLVDAEGLLVSSDGDTWTRRPLPAPGRLAVGRGEGVMLHGDTLHRSVDGGASWLPVEEAPRATALAGGRCAKEWMIGAGDEVYLSRDGGASFTKEPVSVSAPIEKGKDLTVTALWRGAEHGFGLGRVTIGRNSRPVLLIAQPR